jgi:aminomethyltransferase
VYSFVLNAQGRNQGDLISYNRGDYLLVTTDVEQAAKLKEIFDRYIIMDDVEVEDISDKLGAIAISGPKAASTLSAASLDVSQVEPGQVIDVVWREIGISIARSVIPQMDGYEIWSTRESLEKVWDSVVSAGAKPVGSDALELYRITRGVPSYGIDLRERDLPQETGQHHVLNFAKGCYVGQEIVERIRSRGNVHRSFVGFEVQGEPPPSGSQVMAEEKPMGEITSSARVPLPGGDRTLALGYMRREFAEPGTKVKVAEQQATVSTLPFA